MSRTNRTRSLQLLVGTALLVATVTVASSQTTSSSSGGIVPAMLRKVGITSESSLADPTGAFFKMGPLSFHPSVLARYTYALGLQSGDGRRVASVINTYAPALRVDLGEKWTFDYSPSWVSYTARGFEDTFDQSMSLAGATKVQEWGVQFSESYSFSSPILLETGRQTPQRNWTSSLGAGRGFGTDWTFQTSLGLSERYAEITPDVRDWSTMNWIVSRALPKMEIGVGAGAGYSDVVGKKDSNNESYMGRFNWSIGEKLALGIDGGLQVTHFRGTDSTTTRTPTANASLGYKPFKATSVSLGYTRSLKSSFIADQLSRSASWNLALQQRLLKRFFASVSYSRQTTTFVSIFANPPIVPPAEFGSETESTSSPLGFVISPPGRSDIAQSITLGLRTQFFERITVGLSFQHTENRSGVKGFESNSTQMSADVSCAY